MNLYRPIIGFSIWIAFIYFAPRASGGLFATIENLLLLAVLVLVPLALQTIANQPQARELSQQALQIHPFAAASVLCAFLLPQSWLSGLLTLPWLGLAFYLGVMRLLHLWRNILVQKSSVPHPQKQEWDRTFLGNYSAAQFWIDAGTLYLSVGAGWLLFTRSGIRPLDFSAVIVALTAVHFHFTGFLLPVMVGLADQLLVRHNMRTRIDTCVAAGIVSSMPIVALGITLSPTIELIGVVILTISILIFAYTTGIRIAKMVNPVTAWLLRLSAAAMVFAISCALLYGTGEFLEMQLITLPRMVQLHGLTNAFGFILCGLLAWNIQGRAHLQSTHPHNLSHEFIVTKGAI